jgi:hypothetical protein
MQHHFLALFRVRSAHQWEQTDVTPWVWHTCKRVSFYHIMRISWFTYSKPVAWIVSSIELHCSNKHYNESRMPTLRHNMSLRQTRCFTGSKCVMKATNGMEQLYCPVMAACPPYCSFCTFCFTSTQATPLEGVKPARPVVQFDSRERVGGEEIIFSRIR